MSTDSLPAGARATCRAALVLLAACLAAPVATAQQFAAMVSPPRFELEGRAGQTQRQIIEITNGDLIASNYRLRTMDWTLDPKGVVLLSEDLAKDSCRPWVAIERRDILVPARGKYRFRFEVTPPADAKGECRFAIAIEGGASTVDAGQVRIPVNAQIAVIVYVTMPGAKPDLSVVRAAVVERNGAKVPAIYVRNAGTAHGRLEGFLEGTEGGGRKIELSPDGLPILPDETREIVLTVVSDAEPRPALTFPVNVRGNLEWSGTSTPFEARFTP